MNERTAHPVSHRRSTAFVVSAFLAAVLLIVPAAPASAATASLSGYQDESSTAWWGTARTNTNLNNRMSFQYSSRTPGDPYIVLGIRSTAAGTTSFAKTTSMYVGQSRVFTRVSNGSQAIPQGTFYITSSLGPGGCGADCGVITWGGTLTYSVAY